MGAGEGLPRRNAGTPEAEEDCFPRGRSKKQEISGRKWINRDHSLRPSRPSARIPAAHGPESKDLILNSVLKAKPELSLQDPGTCLSSELPTEGYDVNAGDGDANEDTDEDGGEVTTSMYRCACWDHVLDTFPRPSRQPVLLAVTLAAATLLLSSSEVYSQVCKS